MTKEPFDNCQERSSETGQTILSSRGNKRVWVPCNQNYFVTDGIGRNGKVDNCSMPIDGNAEEFELGRRGLQFNGGEIPISPLPSSQTRSGGLNECMTIERDMHPVVQSLLDSPPSFGDAKGSDNCNSCDRRSEQVRIV